MDIDGAIQQGTYISLDAADTLSTIMVNGLPDPVRFFEGISGPLKQAPKQRKQSILALLFAANVDYCGRKAKRMRQFGSNNSVTI